MVNERLYQIWCKSGFVRFDAVIALKWRRAEEELVIVATGEGCNSWSTYGISAVPKAFQGWSFTLASVSPTKSAAAPTSRRLRVLKSWVLTKLSLYHQKEPAFNLTNAK